jgi:glycosyltransferase involved in cell wall biosynthesis
MISIFARPPYLGNRYHMKGIALLRVSSQIRGYEMAEYLGAKLNPKDGYENDVCIHVKPRGLNRVLDGHWVDVLDEMDAVGWLKVRPKVKVISASKSSDDYLRSELENEIRLIPQHHINFDNLRRSGGEVTTGGYVGAISPTAVGIYSGVAERFKEVGMAFKTCLDFKTREDSINLYKSIDIFVIADFSPDYNPNKIPTKIINAASFGVPSVAFPLSGYKEIEGAYIRVTDMNQLMEEVAKLRNKEYYSFRSKIALEMSQRYHISKIAELYKKL